MVSFRRSTTPSSGRHAPSHSSNVTSPLFPLFSPQNSLTRFLELSQTHLQTPLLVHLQQIHPPLRRHRPLAHNPQTKTLRPAARRRRLLAQRRLRPGVSAPAAQRRCHERVPRRRHDTMLVQSAEEAQQRRRRARQAQWEPRAEPPQQLRRAEQPREHLAAE